ncbi:MAG: geranylgeranylglycerol-phosphate geranylgeranyltransferase [Ferruginibacter sp.]
MRLILPFLRLIRWPNLVFIALTQCLFYYCISIPVFENNHAATALPQEYFWFLVLASALIAAAGYIINDYFDLNIDRVNKPDRLVVDKIIRRRWAILWHLILSSVAVLISFWIAHRLSDWHAYLAAFINMVCVAALLFYSTTFKRKLLIGNVLISLLTAWTILVLFVVQLKSWLLIKISYDVKNNYDLAAAKLYKYAILYAGFAFIISLIREVVKDMEDMEGDEKYGCRTMPIVWGVPAAKMFVAVWTVVLIAALCIVQFYVLQFGWWFSAVYCLLAIIAPLIWILRKLYHAKTAVQYHQLSSVIKAVMLAGILSMLFFKLYF